MRRFAAPFLGLLAMLVVAAPATATGTRTTPPSCGTTATCPAGPEGPPGPAGPAGRDGKDATSTVVRVEAPTCVSRRDYRFRVRREYAGSRIVAVTASEPGMNATVTKRNGRFVVSWSTKGKKYPVGGVVRSMRIHATLSSGRKVRLQWLYRPCTAANNSLNDPSAAGQGRAGG